MHIHASVNVSVRPAPLAPERPAAKPEGTDAAPRDAARGKAVLREESPLAQNVRLAAESLVARRVADGARGEPERAARFDLRAHLAEIDRDVRKRLDHFGRQHGLNADELRDLGREFHGKLHRIYEAASETDAGLRQLQQAGRSLERVRGELLGLRNEGDHLARMEVARRLIEGGDGGALSLLVAAAEGSGDAGPRACEVVLDRLTAWLGLERLGSRGEVLRLDADQVSELEVRGRVPAGAVLYRVVQCGWALGASVLARPVVEPVD